MNVVCSNCNRVGHAWPLCPDLTGDPHQEAWYVAARAAEVERERIRARLMEMHERDKERHNYWHVAVVELFGS
jgi:hypothetical protein